MHDTPVPNLKGFAISLYAMTGVASACLRLQSLDEDVCLLLCAAWLHKRQVPCTAERISQLVEVSRPWQKAVVTPLRLIRTDWKRPSASDMELATLREKLKALELEAEMALLGRLQAMSQSWAVCVADTQKDWLSCVSTVAGKKQLGELETLRSAAAAWRV